MKRPVAGSSALISMAAGAALGLFAISAGVSVDRGLWWAALFFGGLLAVLLWLVWLVC